MDAVREAEREAQVKLEKWNRFVERYVDGIGPEIFPGERELVLDEWAEAENRAAKLRRMRGE